MTSNGFDIIMKVALSASEGRCSSTYQNDVLSTQIEAIDEITESDIEDTLADDDDDEAATYITGDELESITLAVEQCSFILIYLFLSFFNLYIVIFASTP